jgi:hypothetical protein
MQHTSFITHMDLIIISVQSNFVRPNKFDGVAYVVHKFCLSPKVLYNIF